MTHALQERVSSTGPPFLGEISFNLDCTLERVFGLGATKLAIEFEERSDGARADHNLSDSSSSDTDMSIPASSTPGREKSRNKRSRGGVKDNFGDLSNITRQAEQDSSGEESDGVTDWDSKKPRLEGLETDQNSSDEETENESIGEEGTQPGGGTEHLQPSSVVDPEPSPEEVSGYVSDADQQQGHGSC